MAAHLHAHQTATMTISTEERTFFLSLGVSQQIEFVALLPMVKQQFVSQMIKTVIAQTAR